MITLTINQKSFISAFHTIICPITRTLALFHLKCDRTFARRSQQWRRQVILISLESLSSAPSLRERPGASTTGPRVEPGHSPPPWGGRRSPGTAVHQVHDGLSRSVFRGLFQPLWCYNILHKLEADRIYNHSYLLATKVFLIVNKYYSQTYFLYILA